MKLYVDGVARAQSSSTATTFIHGDGQPFSLGRRAGSPSNLAQYASASDAFTGECQTRARA